MRYYFRRVNELFRGNLQLKGQHKTCAKRRAELSVAMSPVCEKREEDGIESKEECARNAVEAVLERCFGDTKPFDDIPQTSSCSSSFSNV